MFFVTKITIFASVLCSQANQILPPRHGLSVYSRCLQRHMIRLGIHAALPRGNAARNVWAHILAVFLYNRIHRVDDFDTGAL